MRILAKDLAAAAAGGAAAPVEMCGWVHRLRDMGGLRFLILRDRSGLAQLVLEGEADLPLESAVRVTGTPCLNEKAPGGAELRVSGIECLSRAAGELPFQVNGDIAKVGLEAILDQRALSLRSPKIRSIFRVQATIIEAFAAYLRSEDFTEIKTSKLVASGTEGGTELFRVEYFDRFVYLAQSPQLYKQIMVASGLERVFEIAPAYRAEKHDTPRHLNEYVSLDVEMGFIDSEEDLIALERGLLAHIFEAVASRNEADCAVWNQAAPRPEEAEKAPLIPYAEALEIANAEAKKAGGARIFDINPEAERRVCEWAGRERGSALVFVNEFPRRYRPFYTYPKGEGPGASTMSFDALYRGLEITTGGRRQHDYEALRAVLPRFGLREESLAGYLAVFKYGAPPHGGFAIGLERLTQKILGLANVKEASLFPRDRKRTEP
ncbi:MAG: aspartate--tRNA(Asn) ligase [Treponema sp.]|jgi:nondiscriminating aspartyl-tRNA synthetase|nr:aspartate--tRNA(Asn) ligase [Treponema sp.]